MEEKKYVIYKYTNIINGKNYIGQTTQKIKYRAKSNGSGYKDCPNFWQAIQKYGWNNFRLEILDWCASQTNADELEQQYIQKYKTNVKEHGYNISGGGQKNHLIAEETKNKIREKKIERDKTTPKRHWTKEQIAKQTEARMKSPLYWESRKKVAEKMSGRTRPKEVGLKISLAKKGQKPSVLAIKKNIEVNSKPINQYDKNSHECIQTFSSIKNAVKSLFNISILTEQQIRSKISNICSVCKGKHKIAYGYCWEYKKD